MEHIGSRVAHTFTVEKSNAPWVQEYINTELEVYFGRSRRLYSFPWNGKGMLYPWATAANFHQALQICKKKNIKNLNYFLGILKRL